MLSFNLFTTIFPLAVLAHITCPPGSESTEDGSCRPCDPGSYYYYHHCQECAPSTFQPLSGQIECLPCPSNTWSRFGATSCISCPEGHVLFNNNTCGVCLPGQTYNSFASPVCIECEPGFFKDEEGAEPCLPCPPGSFSAMGSSGCTPCPQNQALLEDGSCGSCPAGKHYNWYSQTCEDCFPGTYTNHANVISDCYQCGGNSFSGYAATECIECPWGEYYIKSTNSCGTCSTGSYYDTFELSCHECGFNEFNRNPGQTYCQACSPGSFARRGSSTCFLCPPGKVYLADIDECGRCEERHSYSNQNARCEVDHHH